ncbi:MAG: rhodanese-like domain-containing protein, partial [Leptospiraceae bacterium]|nr:rhodanese-like domain-containing protein [Leptospiraceae bacterium]
MELHPLELKERLDAKHDLYLLDVRTINETDICLIPGSHIIPLHELADRTSEIPKDKDVIVI